MSETTETPSPAPSTAIDDFKADINAMGIKGSGPDRDRLGAVVGLILMVAGVVIAFVSYLSSTGQNDVRDQNELVILAITGLALAVIGAAVFLRYSIAGFLRFWLLRQLYEGQANVERLVSGMRGDDQPTTPRS